MREKVILTFSFRLSSENLNEQTEGSVTLYSDHVAVTEKGKEIKRIGLSDIKEFVYDAGVGCASVEALTVNGYETLCRSVMLDAKAFSTAVKRMNKYLEDGYYQN